jgi:hypothetical protein
MVDQMLLLLVEQRNRGFPFISPEKERLADGRCRASRAIKAYLSTGEMTDTLLDQLIRSAARRQRSFSITRTVQKPRPSDALRCVLRRIHDSASQFDWTVQQFFYHGFLTSSSLISAEAYLILDSTLAEVKTVADTSHHLEHMSQLLAYYLVSQAPVAKPCNFQIDHLGLYYPRQGQFLKCAVLQVIRFPLGRLTRIAFDFLAEFQLWRECSNPADHSTAWVQRVRNIGLRQVLMEVRPRIPWIVRALKATRDTKPIIIPEDFLLNRERVSERASS